MKTLLKYIIMVLAFSIMLKAVPVFEEVPRLPDFTTFNYSGGQIHYLDNKLYCSTGLDYRVYNDSLNKWEKFSDLRGFYLAKDKQSTFYIAANGASCMNYSINNGKTWECNYKVPFGILLSNETNSFIFTDSLYKIINKDSVENLILPVKLSEFSSYDILASGKSNLYLKSRKRIQNNDFYFIYFSSNNGSNWINLTKDSNITNTYLFVSRDSDFFLFDRKYVYKSIDTGKSWIKINEDGFSKVIPYMNILSNNDTLFKSDLGFFKFTTNGEQKKIVIPEIEEFCKTGYYDNVRYVTLTEDSTVYASCALGVLRSKDYGDTWELINNNLNAGEIFDMAYDKDTMYVASRGIHRTTDEGKTWEYLGLRNYLFNTNSVAINKKGYIYAGVNGIYRSKDKGKTWEHVLTTGNLTNECVTQQVFISSKDYIYTTGLCSRISTDDGDTWKSLPVFTENVIGENNEGMIFSTGNHSRISVIDSTKPQGFYDVNYDEKATTFDKTINCIIFSKTSKLGYAINKSEGDYLTTDNGRTWQKMDFKSKYSVRYKLTMDDFDNFYSGFRTYNYGDSTWKVNGNRDVNSYSIKISPKGRIFMFEGAKLYKSTTLVPTGIEEEKEETNTYNSFIIENNKITLKTSFDNPKIKIIDFLGRNIESKILNLSPLNIELNNNLVDGIYFLRIEDNSNISNYKFIIGK